MNERLSRYAGTDPLDRRSFLLRFAELAFAGAVSRFTLLGDTGISPRRIDYACPGGGLKEDTCADNDPDLCPGGGREVDNCPSDGNRLEDNCESGLHVNDVCNESTDSTTDKSSDQCEALPNSPGKTPDDICQIQKNPQRNNDDCGTGAEPYDLCPPDGTVEDGDLCPGGDSRKQPIIDTCNPEDEGDSCGEGNFGEEDDCKTDGTFWEKKDNCNTNDDDTCTTGKNNDYNVNQFDDKCDPTRPPFIDTALGSDQCIDGTDAQDLCIPYDETQGFNDTCPEGKKDVDFCGLGSTDYCDGGNNNSDECTRIDPDACPLGKKDVDSCDPKICADLCVTGNEEATDNEWPCSQNDNCLSNSPDIPGHLE